MGLRPSSRRASNTAIDQHGQGKQVSTYMLLLAHPGCRGALVAWRPSRAGPWHRDQDVHGVAPSRTSVLTRAPWRAERPPSAGGSRLARGRSRGRADHRAPATTRRAASSLTGLRADRGAWHARQPLDVHGNLRYHLLPGRCAVDPLSSYPDHDHAPPSSRSERTPRGRVLNGHPLGSTGGWSPGDHIAGLGDPAAAGASAMSPDGRLRGA
jgi:hypothetical protein